MLKEKARQTWAATLFGFVRGWEREGQRSLLCTLSAAGKDTWVETRGRREDNDSYDGMTSVDAAQGDDGEYGGMRATEEDHTTEWVGCMAAGAIWKRLDIEFPLPHHITHIACKTPPEKPAQAEKVAVVLYTARK